MVGVRSKVEATTRTTAAVRSTEDVERLSGQYWWGVGGFPAPDAFLLWSRAFPGAEKLRFESSFRLTRPSSR